MKTLIVNSCNKKKINYLRKLLNRLGYNPRFIDEETLKILFYWNLCCKIKKEFL